MSYGTRKAIAGAIKSIERAIAQSDEAITRFDNCTTRKDIRDVLEWMNGIDFFFLPSENQATMRAAFDRANERIEVK